MTSHESFHNFQTQPVSSNTKLNFDLHPRLSRLNAKTTTNIFLYQMSEYGPLKVKRLYLQNMTEMEHNMHNYTFMHNHLKIKMIMF